MIGDGMLLTIMKTPEKLDLKTDDIDSYLPQHQPIRRMSMN